MKISKKEKKKILLFLGGTLFVITILPPINPIDAITGFASLAFLFFSFMETDNDDS